MLRHRGVRSADEFHYDSGGGELLCHCRMRASRRISHTAANPGRKFFGCPRYVSKVQPGCGFFVWLDDKLAAASEKLELLRIVEFQHNRINELESENNMLRKILVQLGDIDGTEVATTSELESLTKLVSQLEMSNGRGFRVPK
ncbi:hypothetical protein LINPERHAP2_LOCUS11124 [Linum perenne]